jgi:hypothetical protein
MFMREIIYLRNKHLAYIRQMLDLNLGRDTNYPDIFFMDVLSPLLRNLG